MANILKIETDRLATDIKTIEQNIAAIEQCITRTEAALKRLNTMWTGAAKNQFTTSANRDISEMRSVILILTKYKSSLEQANKTYDSAVSNAESLIKSIRI